MEFPFQLPDPFAQLRRQMRPPNPFGASRGGSSALEDEDYALAPEERESLLRTLGRKTVGGIGAVANLIDLPGSMIRDTIGLIGSGGNLSKYNPLDQLLTPFSPDNRASGRGLLESAGALSPNRPGFDMGDVAGFGVDLVTDPLSWLSGGIAGAGTKLGKLASKAGAIDDITRLGRSTLGKDAGKRFIQRTLTGADIMAKPEIAAKITPVADRLVAQGKLSPLWQSELAAEPIRSAFGVTVPFTNIGLGNVGRGAPGSGLLSQGINAVLGTLGMKTAQRTPLDVIGETLRWSAPGIHAASLFSAANKGRKTKEVQQLAQQLTQGQRSAEHVLRGEVLELAQRLQDAGRLDEATSWTLRSIGEGVAPLRSNVSGVAGKLRDLFDDDMRKAWAAGLDRNPIDDVIDYVSRYVDPEYAKSAMGSSKPFRAKAAEDTAREWIFKGVRGGTQYLNERVIKDQAIDAFINQRLPGVTNGQQLNQLKRDVADLIEARHGNVVDQWHQVTRRGKTRNMNRYRGLAGWLIKHPEQRKNGLYTGHVLADANRRLATSANEVETANAVLGFIGENALPVSAIPDGVRVNDVLKKLGGFNIGTTERVWRGNRVAVPTAYDVLAQKFGGTGGDWMNRMIPKDVAEDLIGLMPARGKDESVKYFAQWWDSYNSLWKAAVLTRPARYFRDLFSGQAQLVQEGAWDGASYLNFHRLLTGHKVPAAVNLPQIQERLASKGLPNTVENATRELRIMYAQYGPGIHNIATETVGRTGGGFSRSLDELLATMPRSTKQNEAQFAGEVLNTIVGRQPGSTLFNKPKIRGVMGAEESTFGPVKAGEKLGRYTDDMNRGVGFLNLLKKGWDPEAAMRRINQIEVNYDPRTFTPAEKTLRRLFPFYCVPDDSEALTRNGWKKYFELNVGDELLTYNVERDCYEWQPCLEVAAFECDEPLFVIKNKRHKIRCTNNHRWVVHNLARKLTQGKATYQIAARRYIKEASDLKQSHVLITVSHFADDGSSCLTVEQAKLLGWLITDGYVRWKGPSIEALIYQSPNKFLEQVKVIAGGNPRKPHPDTGVVAVPVLHDRAKSIEWNLKPENLIWTITHLSREAASAMYEAMYLADGTVSDKRTNDFLACQKPHVKEAFLILATLLGKRATPNNRGVCISDAQQLHLSVCQFETEAYNGIVWCPRTNNGTWVMRQGRFITITGNTFTSRMMGYTAKTLAQRPGGPMGQTIKSLNAMRSDDPLLPEYVANTAAIPLGETPEGSKRYLTGASLMWEDPMQFVGGGLGGGVLEGMSRMSPIPKYLAELATGQSFFQRGAYGGRALDDLNPPMGQTIANIQEMATGVKPARTKPVVGDWFEQIMATLIPGGSTITTAARKATEPERGVGEKLLNLGTGFQTSLIRPASQDAILDELIRKRQRQLGGRSFTKTFIPEEVRATMDPVERLAADQITALADELVARKKARKKQRQAASPAGR